MSTKFTPGPWFVSGSDPDGGMIVTDTETLANWPANDLNSTQNRANARAIAALPELVVALVHLLNAPDLNLDSLEPMTIQFMSDARAALTKAGVL